MSEQINLETGYKVLVVDDEQSVVHYFKQIFQPFKHISLFATASPKEALEIARKEKPKVILVDLIMPAINGEDLIRELKPLLPHSKFIVMTGWAETATKERIVAQLGVDDYIEKPIDIDKVKNKIVWLLMVKEEA